MQQAGSPKKDNESLSKICKARFPAHELDKVKWITELKNKHVGEAAFIFGNGWSMTFWDAEKIKPHGTIFGCNRSFTRYPIDYLVWQDGGVTEVCCAFRGSKLMPIRKRNRAKKVDFDTTWFYGFGKYDFKNKSNQDGLFMIGNSGCLAFQMAHYMGFGTIVLAGCDCCVLTDEYDKFRSNIFQDGAMKRIEKNKGNLINHNGKYTTSHLLAFKKKFMQLYDKIKEDCDVFKLGDFGILDMPVLDWPGFYSTEHPDWSPSTDVQQQCDYERRPQRESDDVLRSGDCNLHGDQRVPCHQVGAGNEGPGKRED